MTQKITNKPTQATVKPSKIVPGQTTSNNAKNIIENVKKALNSPNSTMQNSIAGKSHK